MDVGANKGIYSIYLSRAAGANGRVVSFEPQPELDGHLQTIRRKFGLSNMTIENVALSSQPGVLKLHRPKVGSGGAGFHYQDLTGVQEIEVAVTTLDKYASESQLGPVHFIKCDVENHELEVFRGGEEVLKRDFPILLFECNYEISGHGELFDFLSELGYDGYFFFVSQADHARYRFKGRGKYVHYSEFADYEFVRPGMLLRNYVFLKRGIRPESLTG